MKGKTTAKPFPAGNALEAHSLAACVPGKMTSEEFKALCLDVKANGVNHSITLFEGKILDGRARYAACKDANLEPKFKTFEGTVQEARALVMSNNLQRRELTSMQRALVGANMHTTKEAPVTQKEASELVGVGVNTLNLAVRLLNSKNAALITRVEKGEASRSEVDELLYDREAGQRQHKVEQREEETDDEDIIGQPKLRSVIPLDTGSGQIAGNRSTKGHTAVETQPSKATAMVKHMDHADRKAFVEMSWHILAPLVKAKMQAEEVAMAKLAQAKSTKAKVKKGSRKAA